MYIALTIIHVLACFGIIGIVLLQSGKGADIGSAFGGAGSQAVFGSMGTPTLLGKIATGIAIVFTLTACTLEMLGGERASCVSARGAFDMVGGVAEWVADWGPAPTACVGWASFSDDDMCLAGASETQFAPGAFVRGGAFAAVGGAKAGPLAIHPFSPTRTNANFIGFRCAR